MSSDLSTGITTQLSTKPYQILMLAATKNGTITSVAVKEHQALVLGIHVF
jgi:hypothetical protein